eukprot:1230632-Pyramimonas_sp.AAC.1
MRGDPTPDKPPPLDKAPVSSAAASSRLDAAVSGDPSSAPLTSAQLPLASTSLPLTSTVEWLGADMSAGRSAGSGKRRAPITSRT